jgi:hypothetical protein
MTAPFKRPATDKDICVKVYAHLDVSHAGGPSTSAGIVWPGDLRPGLSVSQALVPVAKAFVNRKMTQETLLLLRAQVRSVLQELLVQDRLYVSVDETLEVYL